MASRLEVTILGFLIVMIVMAAITLIMMLLPYLIGTVKKDNKKNKNKDVTEIIKKAEIHQAPVEPKKISNTQEDTELFAIITASIHAYTSRENKNLRVVSFKRVGDNAPAWNMISRLDNI